VKAVVRASSELAGSEIATMDGVMVKHMLPEYPDFYDSASLQG